MSSTFLIGHPFIELQAVESTNNYATRAIHEGMAQHGTAIFAHHQTKGKGQREKQWISEAGKNIALTVVVKPTQSLSQTFLISAAVAIAAQEFIKKYTGDDTFIKWPNDIYWRDRKAAGILIENIVQGSEWKWSVIGIGININQTRFDEKRINAVSFKQITGKTFDIVELAKELCAFLQEVWIRLQQKPTAIVTDYNACLYKAGQTVQLKQNSRVFQATIKEVSPMGELIVVTALEEKFNVGQVEWIIPSS